MDEANDQWDPSSQDVLGERSIIQLRTNGTLCNATGGNEDGFVATWVAVNNWAGTKIAQIGWIRDQDPTSGFIDTCRFWAIGGGSVHEYDCNQDADDKQVYFDVEEGAVGDQPVYFLEDCGTHGFGSSDCTIKNETQPVFAQSFGYVATEVDYGESNCVTHFNGNFSDKVNFGSADSLIKGENSSGWAVRGMTQFQAVCSHYDMTGDNESMNTWDDRNG